MKNVFLLLSFLFPALICASQDYKLAYTLPCQGNFTTDPLGNCYIFSKGDIFKFNNEGFETARYSSRNYGDISLIDASNPMKILIVFKEFSKAVVADAALAEQAIIDLSFPGIPYVNFICTSRENGYWIVDPVAKQIRKINDQLTIVADGTPFRQVTVNEIEPVFILDSGDWLLMNTRQTGLLVFDRFGTYYKTIGDIPQIAIQASGNEILYKAGTGMMKFDIRNGTSNHFLLPENGLSDACRVEGNHIFIKAGNLINIYTY